MRPFPAPQPSCTLSAPSRGKRRPAAFGWDRCWAVGPPLQPLAVGGPAASCSPPGPARSLSKGYVHPGQPRLNAPHPHVSHQPPASTQTRSHSNVSLLLKTVPEQPSRPWDHQRHRGGDQAPQCPAPRWLPRGVWTPQRSLLCVPGHVVQAGSCPLPPRGSTSARMKAPGPAATAGPGSVRLRRASCCPVPLSVARSPGPCLARCCASHDAVPHTMLCLTPGSWGASRRSGLPGGRRQQTQCRKSATLCRKSCRHGCRYWKKRSMK